MTTESFSRDQRLHTRRRKERTMRHRRGYYAAFIWVDGGMDPLRERT